MQTKAKSKQTNKKVQTTLDAKKQKRKCKQTRETSVNNCKGKQKQANKQRNKCKQQKQNQIRFANKKTKSKQKQQTPKKENG